MSIEDRRRGAWMGLVVGDALSARHGLHKIPKRWRLAILRQDQVDEAYGWIAAAS